MLLLGSIRSIMRRCIKIDNAFFLKSSRPSLPLKKVFRIPPSPFSQREVFLKSSRPSLPLKKAPPFSPSLSSIVFTPPSVPPVLGDRNPQGREDVTALRCSEPLRSKVGGASKPFAILCGMGPPGEGSSQFIIYN